MKVCYKEKDIVKKFMINQMINKILIPEEPYCLADKPKHNALPRFIRAGLHYADIYQNTRNQDFDQRFLVARMLKNKGNSLYKIEKYEEASQSYEKSLSIFRYVEKIKKKAKTNAKKAENKENEGLKYVDDKGREQKEKIDIKELKNVLYLNLAACYLKQNDFHNAHMACEEALLINPESPKALYRNARALYLIENSIPNLEKAVEFLNQAMKSDSNDPQISKEYHKLNAELQSKKKEEEIIKQKELAKKKSAESARNSANALKEKEKKKNNDKKQQEKKSESKGKVNEVLEIVINNGKITSVISNTKGDITQESLEENEKLMQAQEKEQEKIKDTIPGLPVPNPPATVKDYNDLLGFTGNKGNYEDMNYELSFESNPDAKVNEEINQLGEFLEKRGSEIVQMYERSGNYEEANKIKERLKIALAAKNQLEKISKLDFNRPKSKLKEIADSIGLDLLAPEIKSELIKIQNQNIIDIRAWLEKASIGSNFQMALTRDDAQEKVESKENNVPGVSNIYINNNFYSPQIDQRQQIVNNYTMNNIFDQKEKREENVQKNLNERTEEPSKPSRSQSLQENMSEKTLESPLIVKESNDGGSVNSHQLMRKGKNLIQNIVREELENEEDFPENNEIASRDAYKNDMEDDQAGVFSAVSILLISIMIIILLIFILIKS